ncbi:hypothetical protein [Arthrobacter sp.]|uniref:hypothetical protein n=1 Tax=Arthrobacter sp. TaxID=1667 RepID=UPI003A93A9D5
MLAFFGGDGTIVCARCAGVPSRFACKTCGSEEQLTGSQCGTCRLEERAKSLLARDDGTIHPDLTGLYDLMLSTPDKRTVVRWLKHEQVHDTLRNMATGSALISHSTLNQLQPSPRIRYLRRLMVTAGTLPVIDVRLNDHEVFADRFLRTLVPGHASILRRYHQWYVLRMMRDESETAPISPNADYRRRRELKAVDCFLSWLDGLGTSLETIHQGDLDRYLAQPKGVEIRTFIVWARRHHLMPQLEIWVQQPGRVQQTISEEDRWTAVNRLVNEESLSLTVRLAGLFVLLYAQPVTSCVRLRHSDVVCSQTSVAICFASTAIEMPPPVAQLVKRYLRAPAERAIYRTPEPQWFFEGLMSGTHMSEANMRLLLHNAGLEPLQARGAAMRHLTVALPARIAADVLGISTGTATTWAKLSGGTWKDYPDLRM